MSQSVCQSYLHASLLPNREFLILFTSLGVVLRNLFNLRPQRRDRLVFRKYTIYVSTVTRETFCEFIPGKNKYA